MALRITWVPKSMRVTAYREVSEAVMALDAASVLTLKLAMLAELRRVLSLKGSDVTPAP